MLSLSASASALAPLLSMLLSVSLFLRFLFLSLLLFQMLFWLLTAQVEHLQRCVCPECVAKRARSFIANPVDCLCARRLCVVFARLVVLFCFRPRSNTSSVALILSASLSALAPSAPIWLSVSPL